MRPTNLPKVSQVVQEKNESPGAFPEHLRDAYVTYTPIGPEATLEHQMAIDMAFVNTAASDRKKKTSMA